MKNISKHAIILAAGKGTRMKSEKPKGACEILGKPMITHIVEACKEAGLDKIVVVVGYKREYIEDILGSTVQYAFQDEQLGTGHACKVTKELLKDCYGTTVIVPGDMPLIGAENIKKLVDYHEKNHNAMTIASCIFENPYSYGRIIRNKDNNVVSIVEEKEATEEQKKVKEINTALYAVDNQLLFSSLDQINNNNNKGEYYLTDIVSILSKDHKVDALVYDYDYHLVGINDPDTLQEVVKMYEDTKD